MERREFLKVSAGAGAAALFYLTGFGCSSRTEDARFGLPDLPYPADALEPHISERTVRLHYGKHHAGYVAKTKQGAKGTRYGSMDLTEIIRRARGKSEATALYNNAAQAFNHNFYWHSLTPKGGGGKPTGVMKALLDKAFGSYDGFRRAFLSRAGAQFGSGWIWLVQDEDQVKITATSNADTPVAYGEVPLLTVDLWEHAYYLDYQNRRTDYVTVCLDHLLNWNFAEKNLTGSVGSITAA